ncbi:hypothetical protein IFO70_32730 [Phormidium tenue FACHB-886]|nr:hypothetical protein [Phormidium tenue FACHB-886]
MTYTHNPDENPFVFQADVIAFNALDNWGEELPAIAAGDARNYDSPYRSQEDTYSPDADWVPRWHGASGEACTIDIERLFEEWEA